MTWNSDRFHFGSSVHAIYGPAHGWPNPDYLLDSDSQWYRSRILLYHEEYYHGSESQSQLAPGFFANPHHTGVFCVNFTPDIFYSHPTTKCQQYQVLLKCAEGSEQSFDIDLGRDWSESDGDWRWVFHTGGTARVTIISHVCTKTSDSSGYGEE